MSPAFIRGFVKAAAEGGIDPATANALLQEIAKYEGFKDTPYRLQGEKYDTIGYGHQMTPDTSQLFQQLFGATNNYSQITNHQQRLSQPQGMALLNSDVTTKSNQAQARVPALPTYPEGVRNKIIGGFYRGDLSGSPKTIQKINRGQWGEASKEFLDNNEYRNAAMRGKPGIRSRMEATSKAFSDYGNELGAKPAVKVPNTTAVGAPAGSPTKPPVGVTN